MLLRIDWQMFVRASTSQKCDRVLARLVSLADFPFTVKSKESYWKENGVFTVSAITEFEAEDAKEAVYSLFRMLSRFAPSWIMSTPSQEGLVEMSGGANTGTVPASGVDSISFHLRQESAVTV